MVIYIQKMKPMTLNNLSMDFNEWWNNASEAKLENEFGEAEQTQQLRDICYNLVDGSQFYKMGGKMAIIRICNKIEEADINELIKIKKDLQDSQIDPIHERGSFSNKEYNKKYGRD